MRSLRNRHFLLIDLALLPAAAVLAFALRLNTTEVQRYTTHILLLIAVAIPVKLVVFRLFGLYSRYWRYASVDELLFITAATLVAGIAAAGLLFGLALPLTDVTGFPRSIPVIDAMLTLLAVGGPRYLVRLAEQRRQRERRRTRQGPERRVLIMGAGDSGAMIVKEMRANPQLGLVPVGFLDDDRYKRGVQIHGVPVLGTREAIPGLAAEHRVSEVIIAMPTAPGASIREILDVCRQAGVAARTIPGLYDILSGQASVSQIRDVDIEDLLRREPVQIDAAAVRDLLHDKRVLVTGGGGSIGGELCRQALRAAPERLVLLGHGENSIFEIHSQLKDLAEETAGGASGLSPVACAQLLSPVIADVRDLERLQQVFARYRPELVFHAAAHKHVPLMEANVCEAIANNVLGTRNLIAAAEQSGVDHFILISTDKAVNPTSVMGVTKRIAELLVYQAARRNGGCFSAVRFGNVLGSRGSVLHTFRRQIAAGKPVTVTHPEMKRYFMTIPEAVMLVLQAAALGKGGEVFVLDMGQPVCMVDLATDLIKLSGLKPRVQCRDGGEGNDWDIEVVFTGVRPGEKLFEELFVDGEGYGRTRHEKIFVAMNGGDSAIHGGDRDADGPPEELDAMVERLIGLAQAGDRAAVVRTLKEIVPQYHPTGKG